MTILHTLNKPASYVELSRQLSEALTQQDSVLLIEDGVYHLLSLGQSDNDWPHIAKQVYALKDDALSRGVAIDNPAIKFVSYQEFVELSAQHNKVVSWY